MNMPSGLPRAHPDLDAFLVRHALAGDWPGGVYAVGPPGAEPRWWGYGGNLALDPEPEPARPDALYDLASLTKPLVTAALAGRMAGAGHLDLDAPLIKLLPEMEGFAGKTPTMIDLLVHRSGLPAWVPLYRMASSPDEVPRVMAGLVPAAPSGEVPVYSCLGPILAGVALARLTSKPLKELFQNWIAEPLELRTEEASFGPLPGPVIGRAAPTERGRQHEAGLCPGLPPCPEIAPGPDQVLRGVVNDGNAAFLGGTAGNAGLFATARGCFRLASALVGHRGLFAPDIQALFSRVLSQDDRDARTFGLQSGLRKKVLAGGLGEDSIGHVGFPGTSFWIDLHRPLVAVLLTNTIHPRWRDVSIQSWRGAFHDLAVTVSAREEG